LILLLACLHRIHNFQFFVSSWTVQAYQYFLKVTLLSSAIFCNEVAKKCFVGGRWAAPSCVWAGRSLAMFLLWKDVGTFAKVFGATVILIV
jgi:hypothetical protein